MVHGDCSSRGCYAMTDEQIQEIYALGRDAFFGGQKEFQFQAFPFRMTALNMAKHRNNPNFAFWKMIKEGYDDFEATHQEPKVAVCEKRYVFDAAPPENSSKALNFSPRGKCPVHRLDPAIADAVLDHRREEQVQMAQYIARDVSTVPFRVGDGGMNPVFEAKLASHSIFDNDGHGLQVAGNSVAPGALPRTPNPPPAPAAETAQRTLPAEEPSQPVVTASVPMPQPAPQPKEGEALPKRTTMASLFGRLFGGSKAQAQPAESETVGSRGSNTQLAAKPRRAAPVHTASATQQPRPNHAASPNAVAKNSGVKSKPETEAKNARAPELRTAYAPASGNGLLAGAQPVVPAGSFENRFSALR
jgi:hypothetical protein